MKTPQPDTHPASRSRRFFTLKLLTRTLFVFAVLVTLVAAFFTFENWRGKRTWQKYVREREAAGDLLSPESVIPARVPDEQNFAATPFFAPLFDFKPGTQEVKDTNENAKIAAFPEVYTKAKVPDGDGEARKNTWVHHLIDLRAWNAALNGTNRQSESLGATDPSVTNTSNVKSDTAAIEADRAAAEGILKALEDSNPVFEELRLALARPHSRFGIRYEEANPSAILLPHLAVLKRLTSVLQLRATARLVLGRTDEAANDVEMMMRLGDSVSTEPFLISYLVRVAQQTLAIRVIGEGLVRHQWNDAQLAHFQKLLNARNFLDYGNSALAGERAYFGGIFDYLLSDSNTYQRLGTVFGGGGQGEDLALAGMAAMPQGWLYLERYNYSRVMQEYLFNIIDTKQHRVHLERAEAFDKRVEAARAAGPLRSFIRHDVFLNLLLPALSRVAQRTALIQTGADLCRVACALERYRLARGEYPQRLDQLSSEYLVGNLPHDIISGKPINYSVANGSFTLHTVGWDNVDQGGVVEMSRKGITDKGDWVWQ